MVGSSIARASHGGAGPPGPEIGVISPRHTAKAGGVTVVANPLHQGPFPTNASYALLSELREIPEKVAWARTTIRWRQPTQGCPRLLYLSRGYNFQWPGRRTKLGNFLHPPEG